MLFKIRFVVKNQQASIFSKNFVFLQIFNIFIFLLYILSVASWFSIIFNFLNDGFKLIITILNVNRIDYDGIQLIRYVIIIFMSYFSYFYIIIIYFNIIKEWKFLYF